MTPVPIRFARLKAGLTQEEVAKHLGVRQATISWWESGRGFPKAQKLPALARLYGCTIDELFAFAKEGSDHGPQKSA